MLSSLRRIAGNHSRGSFLQPLGTAGPRFSLLVAVNIELPLPRCGVRPVVPLGDQGVDLLVLRLDLLVLRLDLLVLRLQLLVLAGDERLLRGNQTLQVGQRRTLLGYGLLVRKNKSD